MAITTPAVMRPVFRPAAAAASLAVTLVSIATELLTVTGPLHTLLDPRWPGLADKIAAACAIIAALGATHLSVARSLLKSVDGR